MSEPGEKQGVAPKWRWRIWLAYLAAWTAALLLPVSVGSFPVGGDLQIDLKFLFGKTLHVLAYAVLAGLSGWLRVPYRYRWLLLFFVMAHGTVTELLQRLVPNRTGELADVGFDHLGVAIGLIATRRWWSEP
jgi:VanZ family protein